MVYRFLGFILLCTSLIACGSDDDGNSVSSKNDYLDEVSSSSWDEDDESSSSRQEQGNESSSSQKESNDSSSSSGSEDSSSSSTQNSGSSSGSSSSGSSSSQESSSSHARSSSSVDPTGGFTLIDGVPVIRAGIQDTYNFHYYPTVQIGTKVWLAENLHAPHDQSVCYDNLTTNCQIYGRLYRVEVPQCPSDFRVAEQSDWEDLLAQTKGTKSLRAAKTWKTSDESQVGTNDYGFAIYPTGSCDLDTCTGMYENAVFLTKEPLGYYTFTMDSETPSFKKGYNPSLYAAIRCVKDSKNVYSEDDLPKVCSNGNRMSVRTYNIYECYNKTWYTSSEKTPTTCADEDELKDIVYERDMYNCRSNKYYKVTTMESTVGFCSSKNVGDTVTYSGTVYACDSNIWNKATIDQVYGECTQYERDSIVNYDKEKYICIEQAWRKATDKELKYGICTKDKFGTFADEEKTLVCKSHVWQTPITEDLLGSCNAANDKKITELSGTAYVCKDGSWSRATKSDFLGTCNSSNQGAIKEYNNLFYICKNGLWATANNEEKKYGLCTTSNEGLVKDNSVICKSGVWVAATKADILGTCSSSNLYETKKYASNTYVCKSGAWVMASATEIKYGVCTPENEGLKGDSLICKSGSWTKMSASEYYGTCDSKLQDKVYTSYICDAGIWRTMTTLEKNVGAFCTTTRQDSVAKTSTRFYYCNRGSWTQTTEINYTLGFCNENRIGEEGVYRDTICICESYGWNMTKTNYILGDCNEESHGITKEFKNVEYICRINNYWSEKNNIEQTYGFCSRKNLGETIQALYAEENLYYTRICASDYNWTWANKDMFLGESNSTNKGDVKNYSGQDFISRGDGWEPVYGTYKDPRDNKTYRTVVLHNLTFMADNLNYETENSWCYNNQASECETYGRLYTHEAAKSACPTGWHLPTLYEYTITIDNHLLRYSKYADGYWQGNVTDKYSELEVKGHGYRMSNGQFLHKLRIGGFWIDEEYNESKAYILLLNPEQSFRDSDFNFTEVNVSVGSSNRRFDMYFTGKANGWGVRCVKDE